VTWPGQSVLLSAVARHVRRLRGPVDTAPCVTIKLIVDNADRKEGT
jgi:hypothetical protein